MTKTLLKILSINILFIVTQVIPALLSTALAQSGGDTFIPPPDLEKVLSVHERFVYNVRYGFLNLGEIEVELLPDTSYEGKQVLHMRTIMRSRSRIPFIGERNVHYQNFFSLHELGLISHLFWRDDLHDDTMDRYRIDFDRDEQLVYFSEEGEPQDTLALEEPASGGDIIFYYSRMFAGLEESYELPVYIENEKGLVTAASSPEIETRDYDAFPEPVETYRSEGSADIDGPFGFTGRFRSWYTTDELRIPVEAQVRVVFGNVKIRLISYEQVEERVGSDIPEAGSR